MKYLLLFALAALVMGCAKQDKNTAECVTVQVRVKEVSKTGQVTYSPVMLVR